MALNVGLVGYGYWGPNLARNFSVNKGCVLTTICEMSPKRAQQAKTAYPNAKVTERYDDLLEDASLDAVLIATPVSTHFELCRRALEAGKHVFVEKPFTQFVGQAEELVKLADKKKLTLAVDHTFLFTGAVRRVRDDVKSGNLGDILYIDSVRINLGLFQSDVNVIYDLAPHDISILCYLIDEDPVSVSAHGATFGLSEFESVAYLHLAYSSGMVAHFHMSWLSPVKLRRTIIGGSQKMIVYDDLDQFDKVKIYDKGVSVKAGDIEALRQVLVDYRSGDMVAPHLDRREALALEADDFLAAIVEKRAPVSDGRLGLRVMRILDGAQRSIADDGRKVML